eukprot:5091610-Prymnesium_polylepis.1
MGGDGMTMGGGDGMTMGGGDGMTMGADGWWRVTRAVGRMPYWGWGACHIGLRVGRTLSEYERVGLPPRLRPSYICSVLPSSAK